MARVLAVASGGGHWIQLQRLKPLFDEEDTAYLTVSEDYRADVGNARFYTTVDASLNRKLRLFRQAVSVFRVILRERPAVIVSTGASIGYFAIRLGKLFGARGIWIDSLANAERLSKSGKHVRRHADLWLTQWPHLADGKGPEYRGSIV